MGSLLEGGSYSEDVASTKALAGSVNCPGETKSICGGKSVCSTTYDQDHTSQHGGDCCSKPHHSVHFDEKSIPDESAIGVSRLSLEARVTRFVDQLSVDGQDSFDTIQVIDEQTPSTSKS